ncbi:cytochrome P450 [Nocardia wallacei]|uniref:cytochrome P450 n=1 Tax=Nocardia wallacei TaxID=480035 RepID=UPI002453CE77|nr:cytochrome P450 [Nocardia wallacei]
MKISASVSDSIVAVVTGTAEFNADPGAHYRRAAAAAFDLVWLDEFEAWVCGSLPVAEEVLRSPEYTADPWFDVAPEDASEDARLRELRSGWAEFADPPRHTALRESVAAAMRPAAVGWSGRSPLGRAVAAVAGDLRAAAGPLDVAAVLDTDLWEALLTSGLGLSPATVRQVHDGLDSVMTCVTDDGTPDQRACAAATVGAVANVSLLNVLSDATPLPAAACLVLHNALRDPAAVAYFSDAVRRDGARKQWQHVRSGIDELLRLDPVQTWTMRFSRGPGQLAGRDIGAGARILVVPGIANRDARCLRRPDDFDPARGSAGVAFGAGHHSCAGRTLVLDVLAALVRELAPVLADFRIAGACTWIEEPGLRRMRCFPVVLESRTGMESGRR